MMFTFVLIFLGLSCFAGTTKPPKYPDPRHILSDIANVSVAERPQGFLNTSDSPGAAFALTNNNEDEAKVQSEITTVSYVGEEESRECTRASKCEVLPQNVTCFDTSLPYNSISYMFTGLHHYWEVQSRLAAWSAFRNIPKCWTVIQPLLCAVFLPKCEDGEVELVARQLCKATRGPCRLVDSIPQDGWPAFLQCNNLSVFRSESVLSSAPFSISGIVSSGHRKKVPVIHGEEESICQGDQSERRLLRFNTTGNCLSPYFVKTTKSSNYYDLIDECGLACFSPQYTKEEHDSVIWSTRWGAWTGLATSIWAFLSTILVHRSKRIRPSVQNHIILCMSVCSILIMIALIIPSLSEDSRRDVLCQSDGTRRISEPDSSQSSACSLVAFLIYFGAIGYSVWLVIFAASWVVTFSRLGKVKDDGLRKRQCSLHIAAWSIPFVLTTVLFVTNVIEADSLSGLCFVSGYVHTMSSEVYIPLVPICLVVLPFAMVIVMLSIIAIKIGTDLHKTSRRTDSVLPEKAAPILKMTLLRLSSVYLIAVIAVVQTLVHHVHIFNNSDIWAQNLKDFLVCSILKSSPEGPDISCDIKDRLSLVRVRLQLACAFLPPLQLAILVSNHTTLKLWRKLVRKIMELRLRPKHISFPHNSPEMKGKFKVGVKKHQLISKAYMKRNEFRKTGRLSLSINSLHEDPMGLPMSQMEDKNSQDPSSNELSSSWVAALPRLIERRNGCKGAIQLGLKRSDSIDSKLHLSQSFSIRSNRLSLSRQHSIADSQVSQMSMHQTQDVPRRGRDSRHRKLNFFRSQRFSSKFRSSRRSSITSHENSSASQILPAVTSSSRIVTDGHLSARKFSDLRQFSSIKDEGDRILEEKLRHLVEASRTSHETFLQEETTKKSTAVQTSLTDLTNLGKSIETKSCGTQWSPHLDQRSLPTTSTASSSQTESNYFLPKKRDIHKFNPPIEPNVIKINVQHQKDSSAESSIPSSYEKLCLNVPGPTVHPAPGFSSASSRMLNSGLFPCELARHNQRRGAIIGDEPITIRPNLVMSDPTNVVPRQHLQTLDVRNFEEIELNVRSHMSRSLLDKNPDSILAISTPSS